MRVFFLPLVYPLFLLVRYSPRAWNRPCENRMVCEHPSNDPQELKEYALGTGLFIEEPWEPWEEEEITLLDNERGD